MPSDPATQTVRAIQRPAVSIVKTASVDSFDTAGLEITYFYDVTNTGNVTLVNANATDSRGLPLYCERRLLPPGDSMTCRSYYVTTEANVAREPHQQRRPRGRRRAPGGVEVHATGTLDIPEAQHPAVEHRQDRERGQLQQRLAPRSPTTTW